MERHKLKVAVYLFLIKEDKILLCRRAYTGWQDGNYSLPSGHLDPNETIIEAMLRETKEEVGVVLKKEDIKLVHTMHRINIYVDFYFEAKSWQGEPQNMEPDKCDDVRWFLINELPENMVPSVRAAFLNYQNDIGLSEMNTNNE
jgi:mutator protein MutT